MPVIQETSQDQYLYCIRHSLSHVLAQAVQKLYPGTKLGFGPPIDDGFYYDFILPRAVAESDLPSIEAEMRRIIAERQVFKREDLEPKAALARVERMDEPHKLEYAQELIEKHGMISLSFYSNGPFLDMCEGPHVETTAELPQDGFKLHSLAGAYWRGDERNVMMTRFYAYAYPTKKELEARIQAVESAKERDHRKLARELKIFVVTDEVGRGLPLWLPNGTVLRTELEKLAHEMEFKSGYMRVATPHITKRGLYVTSGHIPLYEDVMYPPMRMFEDAEAGGAQAEKGEGDPEHYYLKPMNCPHHHMIYAAEKRSYRDLPLRLAEYGTVYRFERAGQLQGIARVRGMSMNDAHIYVTQEQLKDEFKAVMELHQRYYKLFGFDDYYLRLSLWDPDDPKRRSKYVDDPASWTYTQKVVQDALEEMGLFYKLQPGEAAFYGPKVDFQFRTVLEKEFTVSTNQVDFAVPPRFQLKYTDREGSEKTPFVIHRAPLGTHERFISFLIEHYGGAFPAWLAPLQVLILPVSDRFGTYAKIVQDILRDRFVRAEVDDSTETLGKRIRNASVVKVPIVLVVGGKEAESSTVSVRRYGIEQQRAMSLDTFVSMVETEIRERNHVRDW
jgi:threonyl-tRNA synthetase